MPGHCKTRALRSMSEFKNRTSLLKDSSENDVSLELVTLYEITIIQVY